MFHEMREIWGIGAASDPPYLPPPTLCTIILSRWSL